jgi:hypothetical protein
MSRGPKPGSNRSETSSDKALAAWGEPAPDWIIELAAACDASSQRMVAEVLGYSPAAVSNVLNCRYGVNGHGGDLSGVERAVRGAYMDASLSCPELGDLPLHTCREWQKTSRTFVNVNPLRLRMFRACRACPHGRRNTAVQATEPTE